MQQSRRQRCSQATYPLLSTTLCPPYGLLLCRREQDKNPGAVRRLLAATEASKGRDLDRKFVRRQRRSGSQRHSRMWFLDLDNWMALGSAAPATAAAPEGQQPGQQAHQVGGQPGSQGWAVLLGAWQAVGSQADRGSWCRRGCRALAGATQGGRTQCGRQQRS